MNNQAAIKNKITSWRALKWDVEKYLIFFIYFLSLLWYNIYVEDFAMDTKVNTDGIIYIPQSDTYRIKVDKILVEVDAWALKQAWNINQIESILRSGTDARKKALLDSIIRIGGKLVNCPWDDDEYRSVYLRSLQDPIDALYRGALDTNDNVVACMDLPKPTPYYDPKAVPKVYYNDRFPSKRSGDIIDEAIELLNAKKDLRMTKTSIEQVFEGFKLRLHSDMSVVRGMGKNLVVLIKHTVFDRAHRTDIDMHAGLMAKLDTDTFIKLRVAFLLYEALKTCEYNKHQMDSDIFEILYSD